MATTTRQLPAWQLILVVVLGVVGVLLGLVLCVLAVQASAGFDDLPVNWVEVVVLLAAGAVASAAGPGLAAVLLRDRRALALWWRWGAVFAVLEIAYLAIARAL